MTIDEIVYAGGKYNTGLTSPYAWYYLNSANGSITDSTVWWLLSPSVWGGSIAGVFFVNGSSNPGYLNYNDVDNTKAVRPVISLKSCIKYSTGNGTSETPYEIDYDNSNC